METYKKNTSLELITYVPLNSRGQYIFLFCSKIIIARRIKRLGNGFVSDEDRCWRHWWSLSLSKKYYRSVIAYIDIIHTTSFLFEINRVFDVS